MAFLLFFTIFLLASFTIEKVSFVKITDNTLDLLENKSKCVILFTLRKHPSYQSVLSIKQ